MRQALEAVESAADPLRTVAAVRELREAAEELEIHAVARARADGATWTQVGGLYGISKQAAQQRFRAVLADLADEGA
jgi:hypothetical protein